MYRASVLFWSLLVAIAAATVLATPAHAATFAVDNTDDQEDSWPGDGYCAIGSIYDISPHCTLRAAIMEANASPGIDEIRFWTANGAPRPMRFRPSSPLPAITAPVVVDGTTLSGYNGVPLIELDGSNVRSSFGLHVTGGGSTIRGLIFLKFGTGIMLSGGGGNVVEGNYVGVTAAGVGGANMWGIQVLNSPDNRIGGPTPRQRNVISGNGYHGIKIDSARSSNTRIVGNFVGMDPTGRRAMGNWMDGIFVNGAGPTTIGGPQRADGNLISGNRGNGITIGGPVAGGGSHVVTNNLIGLSYDLWPRAGNGGDGLAVYATSNVKVGGSHALGNDISWNAGAGVSARKTVFGTFGENIRIVGNTLAGNGGLDIDLANGLNLDGVTANDVRDADSGPNGLQNFPVLTSAMLDGGGTRIDGTLHSEPGREFDIDFAIGAECAPSGRGVLFSPYPAPRLSSLRVKTDGAGNTSFVSVQTGIPEGYFVVATATKRADANVSGSTSEISQCRQVTPPQVAPPATPPTKQ